MTIPSIGRSQLKAASLASLATVTWGSNIYLAGKIGSIAVETFDLFKMMPSKSISLNAFKISIGCAIFAQLTFIALYLACKAYVVYHDKPSNIQFRHFLLVKI